ncbi:hypothetical protein GOP47_0029948 [Adiantum capillus-veneris]|nr:hypothetical protein GOP47_0029948 [Adiantum capillus-veneris]
MRKTRFELTTELVDMRQADVIEAARLENKVVARMLDVWLESFEITWQEIFAKEQLGGFMRGRRMVGKFRDNLARDLCERAARRVHEGEVGLPFIPVNISFGLWTLTLLAALPAWSLSNNVRFLQRNIARVQFPELSVGLIILGRRGGGARKLWTE